MPITFSESAASNPVGVQGTYPIYAGVYRNGQPAYPSAGDKSATGLLQAAAVAFGTFLVKDTTNGYDARAAKAITAANQVPLGIAELSDTFVPVDAVGSVKGYARYMTARVKQHGHIAVTVDEAVGIGDPVRVRITTAVASYTYRTSAVANATVLVAGAKFASKTTGAGIAIVALDWTSIALTADV